MRVLLDVSAVPARPVGAGVYTAAIAHGLATRPDVELHLAARTSDEERWQRLAAGACVHAVVPEGRPARFAWEQTGALRLARAVAPDLWHGPHYTMPLRSRVPAVVTVHDLTFFDHPEWHERSKVVFFRRMIAAAARRAAVLVCVSEFTAERLRARCTTAGEVMIVPHGVDHARFTPAPDAADGARLTAHGIRRPYIAFQGTLEPRKDVPTLVRAFARISDAHPELQLVLAGGDGWGAEAVRDVIARSGVATRILRPGYLDDATVTAYFRHAAIVAYPTREEGFGLPALEALASGTPLVTTRGSAVEEVVGDAALLVAPGDVEDLARALVTALDDDAVASKLRAAGPARAAAFTWERSLAGHVDAYHHALEKPIVKGRS